MKPHTAKKEFFPALRADIDERFMGGGTFSRLSFKELEEKFNPHKKTLGTLLGALEKDGAIECRKDLMVRNPNGGGMMPIFQWVRPCVVVPVKRTVAARNEEFFGQNQCGIELGRALDRMAIYWQPKPNYEELYA